MEFLSGRRAPGLARWLCRAWRSLAASQDEPFPQQLWEDTLLALAAHRKANQDEPFPQRLYNQWEEGEYTDQHIIEEHGAAIWYKFLSKRHHRREARRLAREHEEWLNRDFSSDTD